MPSIFLLILFDVLGWIFMAIEIAFPATFLTLSSQFIFSHFGWIGIFLTSPFIMAGGLISFCLGIFLLRIAAPRLKEGEYPFPRHAMSRSWAIHLQIARLPQMNGVRPFFMGSNISRFLLLRALGAKAAFRVNTSSDLYVYDAAMITIDEGVMVGGTSGIVGHYIDAGKLTLLRTIVGKDSQIGTGVLLGPGTRLGEKVGVGSFSRFSANITVGDKTHIGYGVTIEPNCKIAQRVIIGNQVTIQSHCVIGEKAVIETGVVLPKGTTVPPGTRVTKSP